ncbi:hypothetical protein INT47_002283 [Mucor saturninus]|uniref:Uncharacterized protein n=1 Tax=Mucor saturninus TaxID=64648 RepID=A0A8H7QX07_9FUNG|nr:hypothetical protein INT47_002283 [Mucor saturninus]
MESHGEWRTIRAINEQVYYDTKPDKTVSTIKYLFYISRNNLDRIGDCITSSRKHFQKTDGTRTVDYPDFFLYIVPTLVVPYLPNRSAKNNVLGLIKGCALALKWDLPPDLISEMEGYFAIWHTYLLEQVNLKNISRSVFRPVQHDLIHVPYIIKQQSPLRCYSARSMERVIGVYSKLIKSRRMGGRNASMLIKRFAIRNFINGIIEIDLIVPAGPACMMGSFRAPFGGNASLDGKLIEGIRCGRVKDALSRYYKRSSGLHATTFFGDSEIAIASRAWINNNVYSSSMYRRRRNEMSRRKHYVMFTTSYKNHFPVAIGL